MMHGVDENGIIDGIFGSIRSEFARRYPAIDPDTSHPDFVAFRNAITTFICPIKVFISQLPEPKAYWGGPECDYVSYIRFDLEKLGSRGFAFAGRHLSSSLAEHFLSGFIGQCANNEFVESMRDGTSIAANDSDPDWLMVTIGGDVTIDQSRVGDWALERIVWDYQDRLILKSGNKIDFNAAYSILPSPPKAITDLLFGNWIGLNKPTIQLDSRAFRVVEETGAQLDQFQLIPKVPGEVSITLEISKQLEMFSRFHHWIGTPATHYAYLAVEAAILHRWRALLPDPVIVKSKNGKQNTLSKPGHQAFFALAANNPPAEAKSWHYRNILVNGRRFPHKIEMVLDDLLEAKVITKWHRKRLLNVYSLRNHYSHREFSTIYSQGMEAIKGATWDINMLFHSV